MEQHAAVKRDREATDTTQIKADLEDTRKADKHEGGTTTAFSLSNWAAKAQDGL